MNKTDVGFTGTQQGMTERQKDAVEYFLKKLFSGGAIRFHHGDCIGADADAHNIVRGLGPRAMKIIIHPPDIKNKRAFCRGDDVRMPKPYLARNMDIVSESNVLIATPKEMQEVLRSGTWSTIRKAGKRGMDLYIVYPDGSFETRVGAL